MIPVLSLLPTCDSVVASVGALASDGQSPTAALPEARSLVKLPEAYIPCPPLLPRATVQLLLLPPFSWPPCSSAAQQHRQPALFSANHSGGARGHVTAFRMSSSAGRDSDDDEGPPPLPPLAANAQQPSPVPPHVPLGYSHVVKLLRHIRRPELLTAVTNEDVNDEKAVWRDPELRPSL